MKRAPMNSTRATSDDISINIPPQSPPPRTRRKITADDNLSFYERPFFSGKKSPLSHSSSSHSGTPSSSHSGTPSSSSLFSKNCVHVIPLVVVICIFILWWFSYPVNVVIKDGRLVAVNQIEVFPKNNTESADPNGLQWVTLVQQNLSLNDVAESPLIKPQSKNAPESTNQTMFASVAKLVRLVQEKFNLGDIDESSPLIELQSKNSPESTNQTMFASVAKLVRLVQEKFNLGDVDESSPLIEPLLKNITDSGSSNQSSFKSVSKWSIPAHQELNLSHIAESPLIEVLSKNNTESANQSTSLVRHQKTGNPLSTRTQSERRS